MSLSCGIVGLPNVGKTTIYNALTSAQAERTTYASGSTEPNVAMIAIPDPNLARLAAHIETKKIIPATVQVVDIAGLQQGASRGEGMGNRFLAHIREADALLHVVQCFENPSVARESPVDAAGDIGELEVELTLADLDTVTRAIDRVSKKARTGDKESKEEKELFERVKAMLEEGTQPRTGEWTARQLELLKPLCLMTMKPVLYVANVGDDDLAAEGPHAKAVAAHAEATGSGWIALCGDLECDLRQMDGDDREAFMAEYGIQELALDRLIHAAYGLLGLQTFYTAGEKEIRAWTIRAGDTAPVAAGKIHTDFLKAFIRAEVYSVAQLEQYGSEGAIRGAGKLRTEGKEYVMRDEDVCHFLVGK